MRPAVFFDRDGTLNEEVGYAGRVEDFHILEGAVAAVRRVNQSGRAAVVITNQAGVARGFFPESAVVELHRHLREQLAAEGAHVDGIYYCPHHPQGTVTGYGRVCDCRKPAAGMLRQAAADLDLDLGNSWVIGDSRHDIGAAHAAGARAVLVRTGYGERDAAETSPEHIAANVNEAVAWVLEQPAR